MCVSDQELQPLVRCVYIIKWIEYPSMQAHPVSVSIHTGRIFSMDVRSRRPRVTHCSAIGIKV